MALTPVKHESDLLALVAGGDERAFAELFECYYRQLGEYVYRLTESIVVSEEIVQDVFIKIWQKREILASLDSFTYYLFILSKNQTLNYLRKVAKEKIKQTEWLKAFDENSDGDYLLEEYHNLIDNAVEKLPPQQKKVYQLTRIERLKHEEVAEILGLSVETVKKHAKLAIKAIKNELMDKNGNAVAVFLSFYLFLLKK